MAQIDPQTPEWVATAPLQIVESRTMNASASAIWDALVDNESWSDWFPGFRDSYFTTEAPHKIGSVRFVHQDQFKVQEEITTWNPGVEWGMTVIGMNVPVVKAMAENVQLTGKGATTDVRWHIGVATSWWARPLRPILAAKSRKGLRQALKQLEARLT